MFITCAFNVATVLLVGALLYFFGGDPDVWVYALTARGVALALVPAALRYPRALSMACCGISDYCATSAKV